MKKLVLSLAVIASMSLFACGGQKAAEEVPAAEEEVVAVEEETVAPVEADTTVADTAAVEAPAAQN